MILESLENGPLLWPTVEENGVTGPKKYSELSATKAIQADCDYASQAQSLTTLSITNPSNDFQLSVHHNVYNPSSSIPQVEYAPSVHQQSNFSQPDTGLVVPVFQKGDDPIDAINDMMSFLTVGRQNSLTAGMSRQYTSGPSGTNSGKQRVIVCYNCKGDGHMSKQWTKPKRKRDEAWFKDKIYLMVNLSHYGSDNIAEDNKNVNEILTAELERYKDQELALEKQVKELNIIVFKRNQSTQTVHMLTKPQFFYDHSTRQALGFQNPCYLQKAQQLELKLYNGSVIHKTDAIMIRDSEETLMLEDESHSKMLQKQKDPMMSEKKVNTKPNPGNFEEPNLSTSITIVEVPKELPKVSMVNSSLKKLKFHLASFDMVVKERTTATVITEGTWGFEHTKACFRDEIIPFVKALKELFILFDQFLIDELTEVQNVFNQME
nr:hypothetical protein [Tanacetum cinerariifolium]